MSRNAQAADPTATGQHYIEVDTDEDVPEARLANRQLVADAIACILRREQTPDPVIVNVLLTGDTALRRLNLRYADEDHATDVLAFPAEDGEQFPWVTGADDDQAVPRHLGDIAISITQVARQARDHGITTERELAMLAIHGTLHLLGYDHAAPDEERVMFGKTDAALEQLFDDAIEVA